MVGGDDGGESVWAGKLSSVGISDGHSRGAVNRPLTGELSLDGLSTGVQTGGPPFSPGTGIWCS